MPNSVLLDIDEMRRSVPDYKERRTESLQISYQKAAEAVGHHLELGQDVIIDKAISQSDTVDSLIEAGRAHGADVYEFLLFADKDTVQNRADERGYIPGSLLTRERVGEMWEKADALRKARPGAILIDTSDMSVDDLIGKIKTAISFS
jgi:predicted kinase